jgi:putative spermidine/putrescine transport system ATP-binding protein
VTRGRLEVRGLRKRYGAQTVVDGVDLDVAAGSFVALLGPSGCGKTTLLRCIAGLVAADAGAIRIDDRDMVGLPPWRRSLGMVFQSYALFPHMSVAANVGFGLRMQGVSRGDAAERIARALQMVRMEGFDGRRPAQLSGGQQQRVALARALVTAPPVLLLDEPLSALDAKLRLAMRSELRELQRGLGITTLFVTHDQDEAMAVADQVAVMDHGRIVQIAGPETVYRRPATPFVAEFIGRINRLDGLADGLAMVRPEHVRLCPPGDSLDGDMGVEGRIVDIVFAGDRLEIHVEAGDRRILCMRSATAGPPPAIGSAVRAAWSRSDMLTYRT